MQNKVKAINAVLPQTQCGECSYQGCLPYATAIAESGESIDRCPPGGLPVLQALAELTDQDAAPYVESVLKQTRLPSVAKIVEADCIGCTKCIQACPVDAIMGSAKKMHSVIADECTGCELCVPACPVDCITITEQPEATFDKRKAQARFEARKRRLAADHAKVRASYKSNKSKDLIAAALARKQQAPETHHD